MCLRTSVRVEANYRGSLVKPQRRQVLLNARSTTSRPIHSTCVQDSICEVLPRTQQVNDDANSLPEPGPGRRHTLVLRRLESSVMFIPRDDRNGQSVFGADGHAPTELTRNGEAFPRRALIRPASDYYRSTQSFRSSLKKLPLSPRVVARGISKPRIVRLLRGKELSKPISMLSGMSDAFRPQQGSTSHSLSFPKGLGRIFLMGKTLSKGSKEAVARTTQVSDAPAGTLSFTRIYGGKLGTDSGRPDRTTTAGSSTIVSIIILVELRRADRLVFSCRDSCCIIQFHSSGVRRDWQVLPNSNLLACSQRLSSIYFPNRDIPGSEPGESRIRILSPRLPR